MMILGTGIDIIEVDRVAKAAAKEGFMHRVFTEAERLRFAKYNNNPAHIAGTFAAKEAISKALGTGIGSVEWKEIEILHHESGQPYAKLYGNAQKRMQEMGGETLHISISHIKAVAAAQAILEGKC